mmetsp:Transcript_45941/g.144477  ORF Transcript_45941/g.144477 Transcript_45941/m.144477 type:complete len:98 (+) Transcript_45941:979-1272(+)
MLSSDGERLWRGGLLQGYSPLAYAMVGFDSTGGVLVSLLLKHTSNSLKNFASPLGIILNCLIARYYSADPASRTPPPRQFLLGTALVLLALGTYSVA